MGLSLDVKVEFLPGGKYISHGSASEVDKIHVTSSFAQGVKRCVIPLRGEADGPGEYVVRLYLSAPAEPVAGKIAFDVKLQGNIVAKAGDPARSDQSAPLEFTGIRVDRNLEIELIGSDGLAPALSGVEVLCTQMKMGQIARR